MQMNAAEDAVVNCSVRAFRDTSPVHEKRESVRFLKRNSPQHGRDSIGFYFIGFVSCARKCVFTEKQRNIIRIRVFITAVDCGTRAQHVAASGIAEHANQKHSRTRIQMYNIIVCTL